MHLYVRSHVIFSRSLGRNWSGPVYEWVFWCSQHCHKNTSLYFLRLHSVLRRSYGVGETISWGVFFSAFSVLMVSLKKKSPFEKRFCWSHYLYRLTLYSYIRTINMRNRSIWAEYFNHCAGVRRFARSSFVTNHVIWAVRSLKLLLI